MKTSSPIVGYSPARPSPIVTPWWIRQFELTLALQFTTIEPIWAIERPGPNTLRGMSKPRRSPRTWFVAEDTRQGVGRPASELNSSNTRTCVANAENARGAARSGAGVASDPGRRRVDPRPGMTPGLAILDHCGNILLVRLMPGSSLAPGRSLCEPGSLDKSGVLALKPPAHLESMPGKTVAREASLAPRRRPAKPKVRQWGGLPKVVRSTALLPQRYRRSAALVTLTRFRKAAAGSAGIHRWATASRCPGPGGRRWR